MRVLEPQQPARAAVIWLHGLGADCHDFVDVVPLLKLSGVRFVFPQAPVRPVTINAGYAMPSWYDILASGADFRRTDVAQLQESVTLVKRLVQEQLDAGIPSESIVLVGFSQGGAVALQAGLSLELPLAGILALSTYLPCAELLNPPCPQRVVQMHGHYDTVVGPELAKACQQQLQQWQLPLTSYWYPMEHELCMPQIEDMANLLQQWLPTQNV
ncbi:alpha/beta hydrolase [Balneatrix alpica]|uniref:alpha/beta hydrolase n=1 Tax=Balneatrix alpica TaxID=75684 RepID=UPI002738E763|nr:alpha/beta fold hydrolase [Balneatrix alpica]